MSTRKKTPVFLQMEATECGAASLGIVAAFYGLHKPLEILRALCGVGRNGSNAANLLLAAEKLGFETAAYRYSAQELLKLTPPVIIHWEFHHFLVYEGYDESSKMVFLNDPATGHRRVRWDDFETYYTGIALHIKPGAAFLPEGKPRGSWGYFAEYFRADTRAWLFVLFIAAMMAVVGMFLPVVSQVFFDDIFSLTHPEWLFDVLLAMGIGAILKGILVFLRAWCLTRWQSIVSIERSAGFMLHVLGLPLSFFQQRYAGEIASRMQFNETVCNFATGSLATVVIDVAIAGVYLLLLFFYDVKLTLIGLLFTLLNAGVLYMTYRWFNERQQQLQQQSGQLYGTSVAGLSAIDTLKANGTEQDFFVKWAGKQAKYLEANQQLEYYSSYIALLPVLLSGINSAMVMLVGGFQIMDGIMTLGIFIAFQNLIGNFQQPVNKISGMMQQLQQSRAQLDKLEDVMRYPAERDILAQEEGEQIKAKLTGALEIKQLSFGYCELDKPLIRKLQLKIAPGRRVAVVGASGCGKSTVAKLVAGLYEPWSGEILFDGRSRKEISPFVFAHSVAFVEQDIFLFEGTVADNIALFDTSLRRHDIIRAAKDACIHEDILQLENGYDGFVNEDGVNFSGGQRQRLEIARALAIDPTLLIFDEATSALDPVTEAAIMTNVRRRGCACLIIAHRLSTIRDCDEIVVLERGRVVQRGTHEKLMASGGAYRRLLDEESR